MDNCVAYGTRKHAVIQIRTAHKCYLSCAVLYTLVFFDHELFNDHLGE